MYDRTQAIKAMIPGMICYVIGITICGFWGIKLDRASNTVEFNLEMLLAGGAVVFIGLMVTLLRLKKIRQ